MAKDTYDHHYLGLNGFVWFFGVVEDRNDPLNVGRVRVRIYSWDNHDKSHQPTENLTWAQCAMPLNMPSTMVKPPREGATVLGYYLDGDGAQHPMILFQIPGIPDTKIPSNHGFSDPRSDNQLENSPAGPQSVTYNSDGSGVDIKNTSASRYPVILNEPTTSRIARNENINKTIIQQKKDNVIKDIPTVSGNYSEPTTSYNAKYPYDYVYESESGHVIEIDDTPGAERIHIFHRSGTCDEIGPDGTKISKITKNKFEIVMADDNLYIMGGQNITINGTQNILIEGDSNIKVDGDLNVKINGSYNLTADGINLNDTQSGILINSGNKVAINGNPVTINGEIETADT